MAKLVILVALICVALAGGDSVVDVATDRDGGGHGHHGGHHADHNEGQHADNHEGHPADHQEGHHAEQSEGHHAEHTQGHHAEHNEVDHSHTEHHEVHNEVHDTGHHPVVPRAGGAVENAVHKMEQQFFFLLRTITGLIDPAVASVVSSCEQSSLKTRSYGVALIGGGVGDTASDYFGNSRTPADVLSMPDVQYSYGYNLGYGVGFGAPFLLPTYVPSCSLTCSSEDFLSLARKYGLSYGLTGQDVGESKICNFGVDAKQALSCLLQNKGDSKEAAKVEFLIDDMVEAGVQRNRLQKRL